MRDIQRMTEEEIAKAIDDLAPPARPFGMHAPEDIGYIADRVREVFEDNNTVCSEGLLMGLVEMFLSEVEAVEDQFADNVSQANLDNLNRT